jgi:hypothetical protein
MAGITTYLSIIIPNVNVLISVIKCLVDCLKKQDLTIFSLQETYLTAKDMYNLRVKGRKRIFQTNGAQKQTGVAHSYLTKQTISHY